MVQCGHGARLAVLFAVAGKTGGAISGANERLMRATKRVAGPRASVASRRVASRPVSSRLVVPSRSFPLSLPFVISASCASAFYFAPSSNSSSCQKKSGNLPRPNALEFDGSAPKSGHLADSRSPETSLPLFVLHRFLLTSFLVTFSLPFPVRGSRRVFFPLFSRYETSS